MNDFNHAQIGRKRVCSNVSQSWHPPDDVHKRRDAGSCRGLTESRRSLPRGWTQLLTRTWVADNQVVLLCAFSALTHSSVTAADGGTFDTDYWVETKLASRKLRSNHCGTFVLIKENMLREMHLSGQHGPLIWEQISFWLFEPIITILSLAQQIILIVAWGLFSHGENRLDPELWQKLWSSNTRECKSKVKRKNKLKTTLIPRVLQSCSEKQLGRAIQNVDNPLIAPRDYEVRHNLDESWSFRTKISEDLSWHFCYSCDYSWVAIQKYRGRSIANVEARDAAKKQKTEKNKKSDQTHKDTTWQSHFFGQWSLLQRLSRQGHSWRRK